MAGINKEQYFYSLILKRYNVPYDIVRNYYDYLDYDNDQIKAIVNKYLLCDCKSKFRENFTEECHIMDIYYMLGMENGYNRIVSIDDIQIGNILINPNSDVLYIVLPFYKSKIQIQELFLNDYDQYIAIIDKKDKINRGKIINKTLKGLKNNFVLSKSNCICINPFQMKECDKYYMLDMINGNNYEYGFYHACENYYIYEYLKDKHDYDSYPTIESFYEDMHNKYSHHKCYVKAINRR